MKKKLTIDQRDAVHEEVNRCFGRAQHLLMMWNDWDEWLKENTEDRDNSTLVPTDKLKEMQAYIKMLEQKLKDIECGNCYKNMLECKCDEVRS